MDFNDQIQVKIMSKILIKQSSPTPTPNSTQLLVYTNLAYLIRYVCIIEKITHPILMMNMRELFVGT